MQANTELNKIALLIQQKQWQAAEKMLQALLRKSPQHAVAHRLLGDCLLARQQWRPALEVYQRSLSLRMSAEALIGMGKAADMLRINEVAEKCYRTALAQLPKSAELKYRLGVLLGGSRDGAEEALQLLGAAIEQGFQPARAYLHISQLAERWLKNFDMAFNAASKALECDADNVDAMLRLADLYWRNNYIEEALQILNKALQVDGERADLYQMFSQSLLKKGEHAQCLQLLQRAVALAPNDAQTYSSYLFALNYIDSLPHAEWFEQHRQYNARLPQVARHPADSSPAHDPQRKLRIGFVSADLREHSVAHFFGPVLEHFNRDQFDIVCYYNHHKSDAYTERFKQQASAWRDVLTLSDTQLAQQIRDDAIDVLVDLNNHSGGNRLPVFALRPAPVQVSWLGYPATTGMDAMDYILVDRYYAPDDSMAAFCSEKLAWLQSYRALQPPPEMDLPVSPLPMLERGHVTFGSFNSFVKISQDVLLLWAELLSQIDNARLVMIVHAAESLDYVRHFFAERGIAAERLTLFTKLRYEQFLKLHQQVDIALDTYPFTGMTTSINGLWMGVPMITQVGERMLSRSGLSLLAPLGLEDFVADSREAYLQKALYWSQQPQQLAQIRAGLRQRLQQSVLLDGKAFTNNLQDVLLSACCNKNVTHRTDNIRF